MCRFNGFTLSQQLCIYATRVVHSFYYGLQFYFTFKMSYSGACLTFGIPAFATANMICHPFCSAIFAIGGHFFVFSHP